MTKKKRNNGKEVKHPSPKHSKRKSKWRLGLAAATAICSAMWFGYPTDPTFEEAQRDPSKRAAYVEVVERKFKLNELPYVEDIRYDAERDHAAMEVLDANIYNIGKGKKFVVQVYDAAFDPQNSAGEDGFINNLIDHEIEGHAKPLSSGYPYFQPGDFLLARQCRVEAYEGSKRNIVFVDEIVLELYAYRNQLRKAAQRGLNDQFNRAFCDYFYYFSILVNANIQNSLDKEIVKEFLSDLFIPELNRYSIEIVNTGRKGLIVEEGQKHTQYEVGMRDYKGPVMLPDGKMVSYFGVVDLPDYLREKAEAWRTERR